MGRIRSLIGILQAMVVLVVVLFCPTQATPVGSVSRHRFPNGGGIALIHSNRNFFLIEAMKDSHMLMVVVNSIGRIHYCSKWIPMQATGGLMSRKFRRAQTEFDIARLATRKGSPQDSYQLSFDDFGSFNRLEAKCGDKMNQRTPPRVKRKSSYAIFPGTKWCGAGNIAHNESDFGEEIETDKCCRTHDRCPDNIVAFSSKYEYMNFSPFTVTHCDCDDAFQICLRMAGTRIANEVGHWFFNLIKMKCFLTRTEYKCIQWHIPYLWCNKKGYVKEATVYNGQKWH